MSFVPHSVVTHRLNLHFYTAFPSEGSLYMHRASTHTHTWMHSSATPQISGCSYLCGACADRSYICYLSLVISLGDGGSGILVLFFSLCFICFHHTFLWCVCSFFCMYATFDMPQQESRQMGQPWQPGINNALFSTDEVCSLKVSDSCETCLLYYS